MLLWISAGLTVPAATLVISGAISVGVPGQWVMRFAREPDWSAMVLALPALGFILLLVGAAYSKIETARLHEEVVTVAMLVAFLFAMQFAVGALGKFGGQESFLGVVTPTTNLYFAEAAAVESTSEYLANYAERAGESEGWQLKTHPPGPVLFFHGIRTLTKAWPPLRNAILDLVDSFISESSSWRNQEAFAFLDRSLSRDAEAAGWLAVGVLRLAAALSALPLYLLARKLYDRQKAIGAAALGGLVPSLLLFNATVDQLYPLIGLAALLVAYHAVLRRSMLLNLLAGVMLFIGGMFSVSFLIFLVLIVVVQAWIILVGKKTVDLTRELRALMLMTESLLIGVLLCGAGVYIFTGLRYLCFTNWLQCLHANALFNADTGRTYLAWLVANPVLFAAFLGLPAAVMFGRRAFSEARELVAKRSLSAADALAVATVGVLAASWLYGANLGEVERLWMPLMPLCAMLGMCALKLDRIAALGLLALQGLQAIVFRLSLDPLGLGRIIEDASQTAGALH